MLLGVSLPIVVFEVLGYACLGLCIWHALHQGPLRRVRLIELGIGVLYGLTLETLTILQLHGLPVWTFSHYVRPHTIGRCRGLEHHPLQRYGVRR